MSHPAVSPRPGSALVGLAGILALALSGCEAPDRLGLPTLVNVVARLDDGAYISLLVDLGAPRERPDLLVSEGLISYDGQRLLELAPGVRVGPEGVTHELTVRDLLRSAEFTVSVVEGAEAGAQLQVVHLRERSVLLCLVGPEGVRGWWEVGLSTGETRELPEAHAIRRFERYGPERGFAVFQDEDELMLALPRGAQGDAIPLIDHVDGIVSVSWVAEEVFGDSGSSLIERRFRMAGSVAAMAREAVPDGDMREWSRDEALSVGTSSHVARGLVAWENARDASFALAARLAPHELCAAVRVRDDALLPGADALIVETELRTFELVVPVEPIFIEQDGLRAAFTDQASFGIGVEMCLDPSTWTVHDGHVPFRVLYRDQDPGQELTILASAPAIPWPALAGVRLPRRGREGALPRRDP